MSFTATAFLIGVACGALAVYFVTNGSGYNQEEENNAQNWTPNVSSNGSIL